MFAAKCFRFVSLNGFVPSEIFSELSSTQLRIAALNAVQFHRRTSVTEDSTKGTASSPSSVAGRTVKHHPAPQKLTWPRHPLHRLPSAWPYAGLSVTTTAEARNVVLRLDDHGRALITEELKKFEDEKASAAGGIVDVGPSVTTSQLFDVFIFHGFPFIGFGILDNGIMIVAGEYIDVTIGAVLGISTMAAAALGNLISDVAGVGSAGYIETLVSKIGIRTPDITPVQSDLTSVRWATGLGRAIGISLGCIIGMLPLLFFRNKDGEEEEKPKLESPPASSSV